MMSIRSLHLWRSGTTRIAVVTAFFLLTASQGPAQVDPAPTLTAPTDEQSLTELIDKTSAEIQELQAVAERKPEGPDPEAPADQTLREAAKELSDALSNYLTLLKEYQALVTQVQMLKSEKSGAQLAADIAKIKETIQQVKTQAPVSRRTMTDEQFNTLLKETQQQLEAAKSDLKARLENQTKRNERLTAYPTRKEELSAEHQKNKANLIDAETESQAKIQVATNDTEKTVATYRLRRARIAARISALRLQILELEQERDQKQLSQAEQRLPLLRELDGELENQVARLQKIQSRSEINEARENCEVLSKAADDSVEYEREHWCLLLKILESMEELAKARQQLNYQQRFTPEDLLDLQQQIRTENDIWQQLVESLARRPSAQIKERYQLIGRDFHQWSERRESLQVLYDRTFDDRFQIGSQIDQLGDEIRTRYRALQRLKPPADAPEALSKLSETVKAKKTKFDEQSAATLKELEEISGRLDEGLELTVQHLNGLAATETKLYWSYLSVADAPLWKFRWSKLQEEWNSPWERSLRRNNLLEVRRGYLAVNTTSWFALAALMGLVIWLAQITRRRLFQITDGLEARISQRLQKQTRSYAELGDRLHINILRLVARTSSVLWPCLVGYIFVYFSSLDGRMSGTVLLFVMALSVIDALIRAAFRTAKPRFRLLTCSNVVAKYYRRRLRFLLGTSLVLVPPPLVLEVMGWLPYARHSLWSLYLTVALLQLLWFLMNKSLVLKVVGRSEHPRTAMLQQLAADAYPGLLVFVGGLLVAQVLGYRALVTYVLFGTVASAATVVVARMLWKYFAELAARSTPAKLAGASDPLSASAGDEADERAGRVIPFKLLALAARWTTVVGAALLIMQYWGLGWRQWLTWVNVVVLPGNEQGRPPLTVGRILLALLVFVGSLVLSRGVRGLVQFKIVSGQVTFGQGGRLALAKLIHYFILCFGLYFAFAVMQIPLGAVTVLLGTLGFGIGLGLQPVFLNFISGLIMLVERHLKIGDRVEVDGVLGEVTELGIRSTTIKTFDNVDMVIPNANFINAKVVNWTLKDAVIRGKLEVGVAYGSDVRLVERLLTQVATESALVLADPPPRVRFMNFGESSLDFSLYVWFKNSSDRWDFLTDCKYRVIELFNENGIEIPFPQRTMSTVGDRPLRIQLEQRAEDIRGYRQESPSGTVE